MNIIHMIHNNYRNDLINLFLGQIALFDIEIFYNSNASFV